MNTITMGVTTLLFAAVILGAFYQGVKNPSKANTLIVAGGDTVNGVVHGLEGR